METKGEKKSTQIPKKIQSSVLLVQIISNIVIVIIVITSSGTSASALARLSWKLKEKHVSYF